MRALKQSFDPQNILNPRTIRRGAVSERPWDPRSPGHARLMARLTLGLAFHNHQPVGNFPSVFEQAYRQAYEPMVGRA